MWKEICQLVRIPTRAFYSLTSSYYESSIFCFGLVSSSFFSTTFTKKMVPKKIQFQEREANGEPYCELREKR